MFETPRRLHYAAIFMSGLSYLRHGIWPLVLIVATGPKGKEGMIFVFAAGAAVVGLFGLIGPFIGYMFTTYSIRDDALQVNSGWIWKRARIIPLARIQHVNTRQNILHRLLGAAAVQIETAAGAGVEAELAAVSRPDSIELQRALLQKKSAPDPAQIAEPPPLYQLTPRQLFIAGALSNRLVYILVGVAGAFQFDELFKDAFAPLVTWMARLSPLQSALIAGAATLGLIAVGWLVSVAYSLTRFYGFRMEAHPTGLKLTYGLLTRIQTIVPAGRVQSFRIAQPLFYQPFGYCEVYADTAGSFEAKELGSANKLCPITEVGEIDRMGGFVFPDFRFTGFTWRRVSPKAVWRYAFAGFIGFSFMLSVASFALWTPWPMLGLLFLAPVSYGLGALRYRYVGYAEQDGFLASRQGLWRKQVIVVPCDRIQIVSVNQSYFQRRWSLADLAVTTSSPAAALSVENLEYEVARELQERLSLASHDRQKPWRGGN